MDQKQNETEKVTMDPSVTPSPSSSEAASPMNKVEPAPEKVAEAVPSSAELPTVSSESKTLPPLPEVSPISSSVTIPEQSSGRGVLLYVFVLVALLIGVVGGYFLFKNLPSSNPSPSPVAVSNGEIVLPADAVSIQKCSDHRGELFAKPSDIPLGPVYMVNQGKVIGIEYMLEKQKFLDGNTQSFLNLPALGIKADHVNIGLLSQGHEGFPQPHYHVDIYAVPASVERAIVCPKASTQATSSASVATTTSTPSATPKK